MAYRSRPTRRPSMPMRGGQAKPADPCCGPRSQSRQRWLPRPRPRAGSPGRVSLPPARVPSSVARRGAPGGSRPADRRGAAPGSRWPATSPEPPGAVALPASAMARDDGPPPADVLETAPEALPRDDRLDQRPGARRGSAGAPGRDRPRRRFVRLGTLRPATRGSWHPTWRRPGWHAWSPSTRGCAGSGRPARRRRANRGTRCRSSRLQRGTAATSRPPRPSAIRRSRGSTPGRRRRRLRHRCRPRPAAPLADHDHGVAARGLSHRRARERLAGAACARVRRSPARRSSLPRRLSSTPLRRRPPRSRRNRWKPSARSSPSSLATLWIESRNPPGATVMVGRSVRGTTPVRLRLPGGKVALSLRKDGFEPWTAELTLASGRRESVNAKLTLVPKPPLLPRGRKRRAGPRACGDLVPLTAGADLVAAEALRRPAARGDAEAEAVQERPRGVRRRRGRQRHERPRDRVRRRPSRQDVPGDHLRTPLQAGPARWRRREGSPAGALHVRGRNPTRSRRDGHGPLGVL